MEFAESKSNASDNNSSNKNANTNAGIPSPSNASDDGFMNIPDGIDEELPFN